VKEHSGHCKARQDGFFSLPQAAELKSSCVIYQPMELSSLVSHEGMGDGVGSEAEAKGKG